MAYPESELRAWLVSGLQDLRQNNAPAEDFVQFFLRACRMVRNITIDDCHAIIPRNHPNPTIQSFLTGWHTEMDELKYPE